LSGNPVYCIETIFICPIYKRFAFVKRKSLRLEYSVLLVYLIVYKFIIFEFGNALAFAELVLLKTKKYSHVKLFV